MIHGTFVPNYVILETEGACHLVKISGNFGLAVNGKRFVRSSQWKIPGKKGNSKKVGPFSWLERSERRSIYAFLVVYTNSRSKGKKKKKNCHGQFAKQNGFPRDFTQVPQVFFWLPPPNDQRYTGKTVQRYSSYRKHSARKPLWKTTNSCRVIPVQCQVLALVWLMANSEVMRSVSDRFNVTLSSLFRIIQRVKS